MPRGFFRPLFGFAEFRRTAEHGCDTVIAEVCCACLSGLRLQRFPMRKFQLFVPFFLGAMSAYSASGTLLTANQGDRTLSIIDPAAGKEVKAVPENGITGHEV